MVSVPGVIVTNVTAGLILFRKLPHVRQTSRYKTTLSIRELNRRETCSISFSVLEQVIMIAPLAVLVLFLSFARQVQAWFDWKVAKIPAVELSVMDNAPPTTSDDNAPISALKSVVEALRHPSTMHDVHILFSDPVFVEDMKRMKSDPAFVRAAAVFSDPNQALEIFTALHGKFQYVDRTGSVDRLTDLREFMKDPQVLGGIWDAIRDLDTAKKEVRRNARPCLPKH